MLNHWNCIACKGYNDILNKQCVYCNYDKPEHVTSDYQAVVELKRGIYFGYGIYGITEMTNEEELFKKFFSETKIFVKDMDMTQLREHREGIHKIAFEAKARLVAIDDEVKDREKKTKNKEWLVSSTNSDVNVSDAINAVENRKKRMSKMDKLKAQLASVITDEAILNDMIKNLERGATDSNLKAISFQVPKTETEIMLVQEKKPEEVKEPFDWGSITNNSD